MNLFRLPGTCFFIDRTSACLSQSLSQNVFPVRFVHHTEDL